MELHQARYFVALAKSLNFTRAAEQCRVTQPALTKAVQKLEKELDGPLIYRERELTQLTDLGKLVLPMVERTLAAAEAVRVRAYEFQRKGIAPLKIALESSVSANLLVGTITEVTKAVPGLQLELLGAPAQTLASLLLDGVANAAITGDNSILPDRIDYWRLFDERIIVLAAAGSTISRQQPISLQALVEATWLEHIGGHIWQQFCVECFPEGQEPKIAHRGQEANHLQHMIAAGLGITPAPEHTPHLPSLVACPIAGDPLRRQVRLLVVAGRHYSPALDAFIKILRSRDWELEGAPSQAALMSDEIVAE